MDDQLFELPPSSFDPALHLHPDQVVTTDLCILPSSTASEDLEAFHEQRAERVAALTKEGIVIQHRAWKTFEAFRSDEDYLIDTPAKKRDKVDTTTAVGQFGGNFPSSPPNFTMAPISSPIQYPLSSSPAIDLKLKNGAKFNATKKPRLIGGFIMDDGSDSEDESGNTGERSPLQELANEKSRRATRKSISLDRSENIQLDLFSSKIAPASFLGTRRESIKAMKDARNSSAEEDSTSTLPFDFIRQTLRGGRKAFPARTCSGKNYNITTREISKPIPYEQLVAARSITAPGKAKKAYYGIDIHTLLDEVAATKRVQSEPSFTTEHAVQPVQSIETSTRPRKSNRTLMWTEKYRARQFTDLVGDERTHRQVLRWVKNWDPIVFPHISKPKPMAKHKLEGTENRPHRKIMLLTGPPGLGKTTLAHVCAKQAGYEVLEINASDDRSRDVVKGRIRDAVGTENVKGIDVKNAAGEKVRKAGRPVCVIVDEVDGVVSGSSGSGEGGFVKALIDLVLLDQKNSSHFEAGGETNLSARKKKKKGDNFRLLRPLILICNDVYHPSLRPLRQSSMAEIIHIRKPPLDKVVLRLKHVFEKEGIPSDTDAVRRLCEATWGVGNRRESASSSGTGEGDVRGVMVVGEWVAGKLRSSLTKRKENGTRLTRKWVEEHIIGSLSCDGEGGSSRGLGRGGTKEVVERVFLEGAGFPKPTNSSLPPPVIHEAAEGEAAPVVGVQEMNKKQAMDRLRQMVDSCGETEKVMTDLFSLYADQPFQDDTFLTKPNRCYDWLHFHDSISQRVFTEQDFELAQYLSQSVLAFHSLFSSPARHSFHKAEAKKWGEEVDEEPLPFTGPRADFQAHEALKHNRSILLELQSNLSVQLLRSFRSPEDIAVDLLPWLMKLLTPDVKPIIVGGSGDQRGIASVRREGEREMVARAVGVMSGVGVKFERGRIESENAMRGTGWIYRMEPPLDVLSTYETASSKTNSVVAAPTRYAVRQVLDQEHAKDIIRRDAEARQARYRAGALSSDPDAIYPIDTNTASSQANQTGKPSRLSGTKRDFFGRPIAVVETLSADGENGDDDAAANGRKKRKTGEACSDGGGGEGGQAWISFHEGFSNAVRKPVSLAELLHGL